MKMDTSRLPASVRFDIDVLMTFIAVAECGSVKAAATRVMRSSAAVSMQMKKLDGLVGASIFRRANGVMRLSEAGERLMPHARRIVEAHDTALATLLAPDIAGSVRIGLCLEYSDTRLTMVLAGFSRAHPDLRVDIQVADTTDLAPLLSQARLDVAVLTPGGAVPAQAGDRLLHEEPLVWATLKGGACVNSRPLRLAVADDGCPWRRAALDALEHADVPYRIAYRSNYFEAQLAAVRAGLAVAAVPISRITTDPRLVSSDADLPKLPYTQMVLRMAAAANDGAQAIAEHVLTAFNRPL